MAGDGIGDATGETVTTTYAENGTYEASLTVTTDDGVQRSTTRTVEVRPAVDDPERPTIPPVVPSDPPTNLDRDRPFEDIDGDGEPRLADVIVYFNERNGDVIQSYPDVFDFDGDGDSGSIGDVLALFQAISELD